MEQGQIQIEKRINERTTFAQTHEVDHVRVTREGKIALEIEWNNKDPFFDRDLENFSRLHGDGGISAGIIVTRGFAAERYRSMHSLLLRFESAGRLR